MMGEDQELLTLWSVSAILGSTQGSVVRRFLQGERADNCLTEELGSTDLLLLVLFLGHWWFLQLPLLPQFNSYSNTTG